MELVLFFYLIVFLFGLYCGQFFKLHNLSPGKRRKFLKGAFLLPSMPASINLAGFNSHFEFFYFKRKMPLLSSENLLAIPVSGDSHRFIILQFSIPIFNFQFSKLSFLFNNFLLFNYYFCLRFKALYYS